MRVLQTLGKYRLRDEGAFRYKRTRNGVEIESISTNNGAYCLSTDEWQGILAAIHAAKRKVFRIRLHRDSSGRMPRQALVDIVMNAVPTAGKNWNWDDSKTAQVVAILEHEGSVDLYGGPIGRAAAAPICLSRDC